MEQKKLKTQSLSQQEQSSSKSHNEVLRLDKFITSQKTDISRKDVKTYIKKGRVLVNGTVAKSGDLKINTQTDQVFLDNEKIEYAKFIYIMLNKPKGVVCSTKDGLSPTVLSLLPPELRRNGLFPAGRLDKDTTGFVLITDDGELAHKMLSPKSHIPKLYHVTLEKEVKENYKEIFESGMEIDGGDICLPAEIYFIKDKPFECYVVLKEGMYHQIKRMFTKVENNVIELKRLQLGGLPLDENLPLGEFLLLLHKDVDKILESCDFKRFF